MWSIVNCSRSPRVNLIFIYIHTHTTIHTGGCWSIVAASVVESGVALRHGPLTPLSAQELLDCDTAWNAGCQGGNPIQSFDFIKENGLAAAAAYPYQAQQLPCRKADVVPVSCESCVKFFKMRGDDGGRLHACSILIPDSSTSPNRLTNPL